MDSQSRPAGHRPRMVPFRSVACVLVLGFSFALGFMAGHSWKSVIGRSPQSEQTATSQTEVLLAGCEKYRDVSSAALGVVEPITVLNAGVLADGGSSYVGFRDKTGKSFTAILPNQFGPGTVQDHRYRLYSATPPDLIDGPPLSDLEEEALCGLLLRWGEHRTYFRLLIYAPSDDARKWYFSAVNSQVIDPHQGNEYNRNQASNFTYGLLRTLIKRNT